MTNKVITATAGINTGISSIDFQRELLFAVMQRLLLEQPSFCCVLIYPSRLTSDHKESADNRGNFDQFADVQREVPAKLTKSLFFGKNCMGIQTRTVGRLRYWLERMLGGGALFQLLLAWGVVVTVALIGGFLAFTFAREDAALSEELWWSFLRLTDPGYLGDDEGTSRRVISTVLTVAGYVLFMGTLVAIMTQWLFRQMRQFELGQTPVSFRQHTVVLGWTSRSLPVVNELIHPQVPTSL